MPYANNETRNRRRKELRHQLQDTAGTRVEQKHPSIPPPAQPQHLTLYARWSGTGHPTPMAYNGEGGHHQYVLTIRPTEEIRVGRRVKILALTPIAYSQPNSPLSQYDTYDPHIVGRITSITRMEAEVEGEGKSTAKTIIKISNECQNNMVEGVVMLALNETPVDGKAPEESEHRGRRRRSHAERGDTARGAPSERGEGTRRGPPECGQRENHGGDSPAHADMERRGGTERSPAGRDGERGWQTAREPSDRKRRADTNGTTPSDERVWRKRRCPSRRTTRGAYEQERSEDAAWNLAPWAEALHASIRPWPSIASQHCEGENCQLRSIRAT
ncbi:hypothetical protein K466DRAFT_564648 [Polyporus arcularius HHB13444]|uniref:Uncharacterized protein n=1 Tax=Polyporus arcularius HHB13444 TaxID=1314778 RepID=A0A5C3PHT5_9APHY|nr:hypothetical protein K466DRAFT_564648 [Polyporus arcularius HHB13444]